MYTEEKSIKKNKEYNSRYKKIHIFLKPLSFTKKKLFILFKQRNLYLSQYMFIDEIDSSFFRDTFSYQCKLPEIIT